METSILKGQQSVSPFSSTYLDPSICDPHIVLILDLIPLIPSHLSLYSSGVRTAPFIQNLNNQHVAEYVALSKSTVSLIFFNLVITASLSNRNHYD